MTDSAIEILPNTRIRFKYDLIEPASGDHPTLIYAKKDETGIVLRSGTKEGYWVKTDSWPNEFGASIDEFEVIKD